MPDRKEHLKKGIIFGGPIILLLMFFSRNPAMIFLTVSIGIGLLVLGSILPDLIEPATGPFHRSTFHSLLVLFILSAVGIISIFAVFSFGANIITVGLCAICIGYLIHLILDSRTKMGLPDT